MTDEFNKITKKIDLLQDIHMRISWDDALKIYTELGFEEIFSEEFADNLYGTNTEVHKFFWRDGLLLTAESYNNQKKINSSNLYYNWIPNDTNVSFHLGSGGYRNMEDGTVVWCGDKIAREGLRSFINNLENNGKVLKSWVHTPFIWFLNFSATRSNSDNYQTENARVISQFPAGIKEAIIPSLG